MSPDSGPSYLNLNLAELRILSRRVLPVMHLKLNLYENFRLLLLLLRLLIRSCSVFYFSYDIDVQFPQQRFGGHTDILEVFDFSFFTNQIFANQLSSNLFTSFLHPPDSGPFYDILNHAELRMSSVREFRS